MAICQILNRLITVTFYLGWNVSEDFVLMVHLLDDLLHVSSNVGLRRHLVLGDVDT